VLAAVIANVADAVAQAVATVSNGKVDSLYVHSDGPTALEADGLTIRSQPRD
jgi:hypothetical protein